MFEYFYRLRYTIGSLTRESWHETEEEARAFRMNCTSAHLWDIDRVAIPPNYIEHFRRYAAENREKVSRRAA